MGVALLVYLVSTLPVIKIVALNHVKIANLLPLGKYTELSGGSSAPNTSALPSINATVIALFKIKSRVADQHLLNTEFFAAVEKDGLLDRVVNILILVIFKVVWLVVGFLHRHC